MQKAILEEIHKRTIELIDHHLMIRTEPDVNSEMLNMLNAATLRLVKTVLFHEWKDAKYYIIKMCAILYNLYEHIDSLEIAEKT